MQVDTNTLLYVLFGLLGVGFKMFSKWIASVNEKLDEMSKLKLDCTKSFLTRVDYEQSKQHVWDKIDDHEERLRTLEMKR